MPPAPMSGEPESVKFGLPTVTWSPASYTVHSLMNSYCSIVFTACRDWGRNHIDENQVVVEIGKDASGWD